MADNRALRRALVASAALHGALFLPFAQRVDFGPPSAQVTPPIVARLAKSSLALKPLPRPVAKPAPPPPAPEVPEAVSRDQYRIELMAEALRQARERYPQLARDNRWEGDVRVGVVVTASGRTTLVLKDGSGHEVLNQHALDALRMAALAVAVPHTLRGKDFAIDVRASYRLGD